MKIECDSVQRDKLVKKLKSKKISVMVRKYYADRFDELEDLVKYSIDGNTFRAFRNLPVPPSTVFRKWATKFITKELSSIIEVKNQGELDEHLHKATLSLCREWHRQVDANLDYGRAAKLINLFFKALPRYACIAEVHGKRIQRFLRVPLDRWTLLALKPVFPVLDIPANVSMGFVRDRKEYNLHQKCILQICKAARVPAIHFDILAWNMK